MTDDDRNGDGDHRKPSPLEAIEKRIAERVKIEVSPVAADRATDPAPPLDEDPPTSSDEDPLTKWKRRVPGQAVTLEQIHAGLIVTSEYAEAAIEGGIKMAADVHEMVQTIDVRTQQIATLTAKVESNAMFIHSVDTDVAATSVMLDEVRKDVQNVMDDMRDVKENSDKIPAIIEMLGEILGRLPEPEPPPQKKLKVG